MFGKRTIYSGGLVVACAFLGLMIVDSAFAAEMSDAEIYFEQNATDGDAEVVISATSGRVGFKTLTVTAPNKRIVAQFQAGDSKLGLRQVQLESPEPDDVQAVKNDYPEGEYSFAGTTIAGVKLTGTATLSHVLPPVAQFVHPTPDAEGIDFKSLKIQWKNPSEMDAIIVVIEQEDDGLEVSATLPGDAESFAVPAGFLQPDTEYKLAIGTVAEDGNTSFVEAEFQTK